MYIKLTYPCPSIGGPGNPSSYRNEVYSRNMYKYIATVCETCIWSIYIFYLKSLHSDKQSNSFWVKWLFKRKSTIYPKCSYSYSFQWYCLSFYICKQEKKRLSILNFSSYKFQRCQEQYWFEKSLLKYSSYFFS